MTKKTLEKKLKEIIKDTDNELEKYVAHNILDQDEPESYLSDVLRHGCQSGMVNALIYYTDTKQFYIKYMDEIDELYQNTCEETGETLAIGTPMYNWMAWFGYEQTAYNLSYKLGLQD